MLGRQSSDNVILCQEFVHSQILMNGRICVFEIKEGRE